MKILVTILIVLTLSTISTNGDTIKLSNNYYVQFDKIIRLSVEKDSLAMEYFVVQGYPGDSSSVVLDTFYASNDITVYDSTTCYGVFCDSNDCFLLIYNFDPIFSIDTMFYWNHKTTFLGYVSSTLYDVDLIDSIVVFSAPNYLGGSSKIPNRSVVGKVVSKNVLDTLRIIPYTEEPYFIHDYSTILFTSTFIKNRELYPDINDRIPDSNITKRVTEYDISNDSVTVYDFENWYDVFSPARFSKNTNMYFYRMDTLNKTHNIWMKDGDTESKVTDFNDYYTLNYIFFNFTNDSQLVYWINEIVDNDTIPKKMTLKIE